MVCGQECPPRNEENIWHLTLKEVIYIPKMYRKWKELSVKNLDGRYEKYLTHTHTYTECSKNIDLDFEMMKFCSSPH